MNLVPRLRLVWLGTRGVLGRRDKTTVVVCPTVELPAEVRVTLDQGIESCSRWPALPGCNQGCTPQVQFSPDDLNDFAARYEGKKCASCGAVLTRDDWYKSRMAAPDAKTGALDLPRSVHPSFLSTPENGDPICSTCYGAKMGIS